MGPHLIELPMACSGPADELWRIEFYAPIDGELRQVWVDNLPKADAESFMNLWHSHPEGWTTFCGQCPTGPRVCCHDKHPWQRGWHRRTIVSPRIMPMREAV